MVKDQFEIAGKLGLVTGSSQGIGKAIALGLAEFGADVVVLYHTDRKEGREVVKEIEKLGRKGYLFKADFSKSGSAGLLINKLKKENLVPDILVVNASIQLPKDWLNVKEKDFEIQVNANLKSTLYLIQGMIPHMIQRKWGRILTIGSVQQLKPHPAMMVYAATKSAVENIVRNIALQVADKGVTINNLAPGVINTPRIEEPVPEIEEDI